MAFDLEPIEPEESGPLEERFAAFHAANPDVYDELRDMAIAAIRRGRDRLGIAQLFEVLRWNRSVETKFDSFKLNNSFRSFYSRMLMEKEPVLAGVFETRSSEADK